MHLFIHLFVYFAESLTKVFGTKFREQVEERLAFFEKGTQPRRNSVVIKEAIEEIDREKREEVGQEMGEEMGEEEVETVPLLV